MIQHDITNDKYYQDGNEISAEEYAARYKEWKDNLPPPTTEEPDIDEAEAFEVIFGGGGE